MKVVQVWITVMLVAAFITTGRILLMSHPRIVALGERIKAQFASNDSDDESGGNSIREETAAHCEDVQAGLVLMSQTVVIACVFGPLVPCLLIMVPLVMLTHFCAFNWLQTTPIGDKLSFGQILAANVMVHQPNISIMQLSLPLTWTVSGFAMWDLEFDVIPMTLYAFLNLSSICAFVYFDSVYHLHHRNEDDSVASKVLWFNRRGGDDVDVITFR